MTIQGIGIDIIEIDRIKKTVERQGETFLNKILTKREKNCYNFVSPFERIAGRFTAKEAIVKAIGIGINKDISWLDIEIINDSLGKPIVTFSEKINQQLNSPLILISLSHTKNYATAIAIWQK